MSNLSGFSTGNFAVLRSDPHTLIVQHSRSRAFAGVSFLVVFMSFWYWLALEKPDDLDSALQGAREQLHDGVVSWLFLIAPLLILVPALIHLGLVLLANPIRLDGSTRTLRYGRKKLPFHQVERLQLRQIHGSDAPDEYLVSLVLRDRSKLRVVSHQDRDRVLALADDLAEILDVPIEQSGRDRTR